MHTRLNARGISYRTLEQAADTLRALAHPVRLKLIELLMREDFSVGELAERVKLPSHAVSQHLNHMRNHGILSRRREGRTVYYQVKDPNAISVLRCIQRQQQTSNSFQGGEAI